MTILLENAEKEKFLTTTIREALYSLETSYTKPFFTGDYQMTVALYHRLPIEIRMVVDVKKYFEIENCRFVTPFFTDVRACRNRLSYFFVMLANLQAEYGSSCKWKVSDSSSIDEYLAIAEHDEDTKLFLNASIDLGDPKATTLYSRYNTLFYPSPKVFAEFTANFPDWVSEIYFINWGLEDFVETTPDQIRRLEMLYY